MYICICNPTTDSQIKECLQDGCSLNELKNNLSLCMGCGTCEQEVEKMYNEYTRKSI